MAIFNVAVTVSDGFSVEEALAAIGEALNCKVYGLGVEARNLQEAMAVVYGAPALTREQLLSKLGHDARNMSDYEKYCEYIRLLQSDDGRYYFKAVQISFDFPGR